MIKLTKQQRATLLNISNHFADSPTLIERGNLILVSAEDGNYFADYYGEFSGGYPWVDPKLEDWAETNGYYWEWENAGAICLAG